MDVFFRPTPAITGALTLNTDFSDAPVDLRQTNLTRFRAVLPRDARLLPAGRIDLPVRRTGRRERAAVLLAAHRHRRPRRGRHRRGRQGHGPRGSGELRRVARAHRLGSRARRAAAERRARADERRRGVGARPDRHRGRSLGRARRQLVVRYRRALPQQPRTRQQHPERRLLVPSAARPRARADERPPSARRSRTRTTATTAQLASRRSRRTSPRRSAS